MTQVALKVKNPQKPSSEFNGKFLVDSGATYTVVPEDILKRLGIKPKREEEFSFTLEALGLTLDPLKRKLYKAILRL